MNIQLPQPVSDALQAQSFRAGLDPSIVASHVLAWFLAQPQAVQRAIFTAQDPQALTPAALARLQNLESTAPDWRPAIRSATFTTSNPPPAPRPGSK